MIAASAGFSCELSIFELMGTPSIKNLLFTPEHTTFIQDVPMKWVLLYTSCNQLAKCRGINMVPDPF